MKEVNLLNLPNKRHFVKDLGNFRKGKTTEIVKKNTRPTISFNKSKEDNLSLRFLDGTA